MRYLISILFLCGLGTACFGQVEFVGFMESAEGRKFALRNTKDQKSSEWLRLDQSFGDVRLVAYDAKRAILTVERQGAHLELPLRDPQVQNTTGAAASPDSLTKYKVGSVIIKISGETAVPESVVLDAMQIRPGGSFNEASLDHDIRSICRTGRFKSVEIKHEKRSDDTLNLIVTVAPKTL